MVTLTYFEAALLIILMITFLIFSFKSRTIIYVKDKNFLPELRKQALDSITEDIRESIYENELNDIKSELRDEGELLGQSYDEFAPKDQSGEIKEYDISNQINNIQDK